MNNTLSRTITKNIKKITLIAVGAIIFAGLIGYGTTTILKSLHAPTISSSQPEITQAPVASTPAQAKAIAATAMTRAADKAIQGNQKDALADYQTAYDNYKIAGDTAGAKDAQFSITSIKSALAAQQNITKPTGGKTSSKQ